MAVREFKKKPKIYNVVEGREALWKSLKSSYSRNSVPPTKKPCPVQNFCDSSDYEYQCNDVGNKLRNDSGGQLSRTTVVGQQPPLITPPLTTSDDSTTSSSSVTTPPPPPPLLAPPPLMHRGSAGQHCSWSSGEVRRLRRRASVVHAIFWPEDDVFADNEEQHDTDVESKRRDDGSGTEEALPLDSSVEEEQRDSWAEEQLESAAEEERDENDDGATRFESADENEGDDGTADRIAEVIVTPQSRAPEVVTAGGDQFVFKFFSPISFIPGSSENDDESPTVEDDDNDEPTLVFDRGTDDQRFSNYTGIRRLCYDDDDGPATIESENIALSRYEMRVKEVDENILFYSKRFLCAVMFFVLLRVFF